MKLYNSLTRKIEDFVPYERNVVKLYTCGPTVYDYAHIGNLRTYIHEDVLDKTISLAGYQLIRSMNVTDVGHLESDADAGDDKMLLGAKRENKTVYEIAEYYQEAFFKDMATLNNRKPDIIKKATSYIAEYIEFIEKLEANGYTYFKGGNVYFDVSKCADYTQLSHLDLSTLKTASRDEVTVDTQKKNPQDFVLWFTKSKFENQEMKWDSPWGVGYPGWHIECSVIALKTLGERLDIHCGGVDHIPVHHTNEIAQTEGYTGKKWCNYWWHSEFLVVDKGKMSKSKGEFLTLSLLMEKGYHPLAYRYYVLGSHYRKQLAFSFKSLDEAQNAYLKLRKKTSKLTAKLKNDDEINLSDDARDLMYRFKSAIFNDLNTANVLTVLFKVVNSKISDDEKVYLISKIDSVLSLDLLKKLEDKTVEIDAELEVYIKEMIAKRLQAKKEKNYKLADEIRDELLKKNVELIDGKDSCEYRIKGA